MTHTYDFNAIETRWQQTWEQDKTFKTPNPGEAGFDPNRPKFYVLDMFPYPSGVGLHVGHPLGYIATDIVARYKRMHGYNVLHPMGYDAFGLPAEQFAVEHGVHPRVTTDKNIANMTRQLKRLGLGYDWDRCLATTDPKYYKWTQWIFLQLYNSWFNPVANKAEPISELVQALEAGDYDIGPDGELISDASEGVMDTLGGVTPGARKWTELEPDQQARLLDEYRLAYLAEVPVNWCPALGTVLANEEVTNEGKSERGNHPVYKRPMKQWMLRITAYCERLSQDLDLVDWPEPIKLMQRNWIGRSEGAEVHFPLAYGSAESPDDVITVFTTRPDTLFGATYMVLAPEHPLVDAITTEGQRQAVKDYQAQAAARSDVDRQADTKTKTGVFTGAYALNPVNSDKIPIWIADYVMMGYGTGAIMAVPAHDQRDFDFARQFDLPIKPVVLPTMDWLKEHAPKDHDTSNPQELQAFYLMHPDIFDEAFTGHGAGVQSENDEVSLNGLLTPDAKSTITDWLEKRGFGKKTVQYKLRDWLFSRQRYWGEPFPILHAPDGHIVPVPESELPVELPEMDDFTPHASDDPDAPPQTPLSRAPDSWKYVERNGVRYTRELNTMPQWAGSCWYYLRYLDPHNDQRFVSKESEQYWMDGNGVDLYVGGAEHAVLHLLYARFWHKVLYDLGHVGTPEPFGRLFNQGYIQAYAYTDSRGVYVPAEEVEERDGRFFYQGQPVSREFGKMGKSLKNAVSPDEVCEQYGCDTLRLYEMYLGPLDQSKVWNTRDIIGVHRFLQRLWRNFVNEQTGELLITDEPADETLRRKLHKTIKRVTDSMEAMAFNVAIAALIELNNELVPIKTIPREVADAMLRLLSPIAPHICEELWHRLGNQQSVSVADWPKADPALLVEDMIEYPVQVNGKLRGKVTVPADADEKAIEEAARADDNVAVHLEGKTIRKVIIVPKRLINLVVG
ncbi:MAG: leucine--tRNA ligase [Phycisphaeraceae bacterium]